MVTQATVTASPGILPSGSAAEERRQSLGFAAKSHAAELGLRRASENHRELEHDEVLVLQEAMREVWWTGVPPQVVLGEHWPMVLQRLTVLSFRVAKNPGPELLHSHPDHHVIGDAYMFKDRDWLRVCTVLAVHVEACAYAVGQSFDLSPEEVSYVTHSFTELAQTYERVVNATAIYNALTWVFGRASTAARNAAIDDLNIKLAFAATKQKWVSPCLVPASLRRTDTVIIPGGPHAGEVLTAEQLRLALVGERFASHFQR